MSIHQQCAERAGFLFKHGCERAGVIQCGQCGKNICHEHATKTQGNLTVCVSCLKSSGSSNYSQYTYNPYFYGYNHYNGWGSYRSHGHYTDHHHDHDDHTDHDADDFTEADGAATEFEGDEGFETDMEGS